MTETAVLGDEIRNVEGGYAVQVPAGWEVIQEAGQILLASPDANTYVGPRLGMLGERLEEPLTLDALLDQTLQEIFGSLSTEGFEVGEPFDLMFGGVPALGIEIIGPFGRADDGDVIAHIVVALSGENQSFMLAGFATTDRWRDEVSHLFDEVVRTVTFFEIENK